MFILYLDFTRRIRKNFTLCLISEIKKEVRTIGLLRERKETPDNSKAKGKKKESAGEGGLDSSPGTLLLLDR